MAKKHFLVGVAFALAAATVFAGGSSESSGNTTSASPVKLTMAFFTFGQPMGDLELVQAAINKISEEKIGAVVKLTPTSIGAWSQQINLMLASGEPLDLSFTGLGATGGFQNQVARNQLTPLNTLIEKYGKGIQKAVAPEFLNAAKVDGKIYAVPSVRDFAAGYGISFRKSILDKYKIDPTSVKTYADYEKLMLFMKRKEPELTPTFPGAAGSTMVQRMLTWDSLGDDYGVLMDYGKTLKVVDLYETKEYADVVKMVRRWYEEGLVLKDAATNRDGWASMVKANKLFSLVTTRKPGLDAQVSKEAGEPMVTVGILPARSTTSNVANVMWAVPRNSKTPEKAVQFLDLMYSNKDIVNLFDWGIEGKDYVKTPDGFIDYPQGVNANNTGWGLAMGWLFGDQFLSYIWKGDPANLYTDLENFNNHAIKSKALGFSFDPTPVKTEYAAVSNVGAQYLLALENGAIDPDVAIPEMVKRMKEAGLDKIIAAKQKQLDAWAAANGVK